MFFPHETLDVYRVALDFVGWSSKWSSETELPASSAKAFDKTTTSIVLNIAEGNGRFSGLDHARFLGIAARSAVRCAAYLDIAATDELLDEAQLMFPKGLLVRVVEMLAKLSESVKAV